MDDEKNEAEPWNTVMEPWNKYFPITEARAPKPGVMGPKVVISATAINLIVLISAVALAFLVVAFIVTGCSSVDRAAMAREKEARRISGQMLERDAREFGKAQRAFTFGPRRENKQVYLAKPAEPKPPAVKEGGNTK